jgi:hypothetical protein
MTTLAVLNLAGGAWLAYGGWLVLLLIAAKVLRSCTRPSCIKL